MAINQPSRALLITIRAIDTFTDVTGSIIAWLTIPMVGAVAYEVIARYLFHSPTIWSFDLTYMLYGTLFMLGAAYALHKGAHIRTDFFWEAFTPRKKGLIDAISYVLFFFPAFVALFLISLTEANYSLAINEMSDQTPWRPVLWPFKYMVPLACLLLLIQGVSEFLKSFYMARTGVELEHKEKVEV
jgi:TRAP-type mannitol/chloroaromatic compound transport system permease small subunit